MPLVSQVTATAIPRDSSIRGFFDRIDLEDAFEAVLPADASCDAETLARHLFSNRIGWVASLMTLRDALVRGFGLKTSGSLRPSTPQERHDQIFLFRIYRRSAAEVVMGQDDIHLDFRVSVFVDSARDATGGIKHVVVSTVVHCHNPLGRAYLFVVRPFHRMVVRATLREASRGWPADRPTDSD